MNDVVPHERAAAEVVCNTQPGNDNAGILMALLFVIL